MTTDDHAAYEGAMRRPVAESGVGDHVEVLFPDRSETLIMSGDIAQVLAEEMLEIVETEEDNA